MNYDSLIMPAGSDYQAAIQHPDFCFKDEELASSSPIKNTNGLPSSASGRFAIVFPLKNHSKNLAVRCFTIFPKDQEKRYTLIDKALKQAKLPFFVDFTYKEEGIYLKNKWYPVLKMDWIEGKLLDQYIFDNKESPDKLEVLKNELLRIFKALKKNSIAHCDLQPGNIIVTDKGIKLVDYDGLYVPGMEGMTRNEMGTPNYQHPALTTEDFNEEMDEFSIWTILLSITALQLNSRLLTKKTFERDYILFQQSDFKDPDNSRIFKELKKLGDQKFQKLLEEFSIMCKEQMLEEYAIDHNWSVKIRAEKKPSTKTISAPDRKVDRPRSSERAEANSGKRMPAMVYVEKGSFTMGDTWGGGYDWEKPIHGVTFTYGFHIGKYETTFEEYDAFCNATGRGKPHDRGWGRGIRPVINVSWWDAIAYCNWLSEKEELPKAYDNNGNLLDKDGRVTTDPSKVVGYRLPTEAEWEYAARGGNKSRGYQYAGSSTVGDVAWYDSNSGGKTQEVGKKAPNELGIYDMSGNVWEWCSDWYGDYSSSAQTNPYNSTTGSLRVHRGGGWSDDATDVRVAFRLLSAPARTFDFLGFRIARTVTYEGENRVPFTPHNPNPSDKETNQKLTVILSWECSDPDGNPLTYDIYFDTNTKPRTKVSSNQSEKTLNRTNLSYNTTYYWKVVAKNNKGAEAEGPIWNFTTAIPPERLTNPSPLHKALNQPTEVKLSWECSDPDGNPLTYDIYFDTEANPTTKISSDQIRRTLNISNLSYGTTYYWRVVAKDSKGATTEGPVWRFSTQDIDLSSYKPPIVLPPMVLVEKGSFTMGDTWGEGGGVAHTVAFTYNFYIGKYETAFDEYDIFCEDTLRSKPDDQGWERGQRPAINISWWDAIAYCNWLSEREGLPVAYRLKGDLAEGQLLNANGNVTTDITKVVGYRLPTEAEWEYAARGGKKSRGYKYSGSDNVDNVAWYNSNSGSRTQEVGKKAPNELGIYDMSGNVEEWCSDWWDSNYSYYSKSPSINPYNSTADSGRVMRGGSCLSSSKSLLLMDHRIGSPDEASHNLGFRLCRTIIFEERDKPPYEPHKTGPLDEATRQPLSLELTWSCKDPSGKPLIYDVYFDANPNPTTKISSNQSSNKMERKSLSHNTTYYWKVIAKNNHGAATESRVWKFTTVRPPKLPYDPKPLNDATGQPLKVMLSWKCRDPDGNPLTYDVYFDTNPNPTTKVSSNQSDRTLERSDLSYNTTYYWKVVAKNDKGLTIEGPVWRFTMQRNPNEPSNPGPLNGTTKQPLEVALSWNCSYFDGDPPIYDIYFDTNANPTTKASSEQSGKSLNITNLSYNTTYYWKVVAKNDKGLTIEGPVWRFTTRNNRPPNTPSNPGPYNTATNQPVTLALLWDCSDPDEDPLTYDIYFDTNANPTTKASSEQSGKSLNITNLSYNTTYYWKVVAKNDKGLTIEGPVWRFTTTATLPYKPSSAVPAMIRIEKGSFTMGDTWGGGDSDEKPTHKVTFTYDFYIGKYEVTFNEYDAFCNATGRSKPNDEGWGRGTRPVIWVSWWDAIAYCNWLSEREKLPKAYDNNGNFLDKDGRETTDPSKVVGYRLPTEAEWEYAARGGNKSKGYKYSGSDNVNDVAWYDSNSGNKTQEVGRKAPNELGLYDMSGNVWEWVKYKGYKSKALKGGCFFDNEKQLPITERIVIENTYLAYEVGFRIVMTVSDETSGTTKEGAIWRFTAYSPLSTVLVEKGSFTMGDTWGDGFWEKTPHKVPFTYNFYIGKYETTFEEYDAFCNATGRGKPHDWGWGRGTRPGINVSWWDAIAYCNWLSEKEKLPKAYDDKGNLLDKDGVITTDPSKVVGYRLPTEAEWEYAARGGNKSKGYKYAGSDNVDDVAWYTSNSGGKTQEVGKKAPNELGIYDMSGNVWEWCSDWYDRGYYSKSPTANPYNSTTGSNRVIRGGSCYDGASNTRVAARSSNTPTNTRYALGFRIARTAH